IPKHFAPIGRVSTRANDGNDAEESYVESPAPVHVLVDNAEHPKARTPHESDLAGRDLLRRGEAHPRAAGPELHLTFLRQMHAVVGHAKSLRVSREAISSSRARTTATRTREPSASMSQSGSQLSLRVASSSAPRNARRSHTSRRTRADPSPMPAVKTTASRPPQAIAIAATAAATR